MTETLSQWWELFTGYAEPVAAVLGYWGAALLVLTLAAVSWLSNFVTLPGNWFVVLVAAISVVFELAVGTEIVGWPAVIVLLALAGLGELLEFAAGAAGAAKRGASRRALLLSLVVSIAGSILGAACGVPIPVVGPLIGAVIGGAVGAYSGAYLGEWWKKDRAHAERSEIGRAAFTGRLLGTTGKILVGGIMLAVLAVAMVV